jgi:dihydrofolate synthase/folylpolyglutamate synthase
MSEVKNFSEVHKLLAKFVPRSRDFRGQYNLSNMRLLLAKLGNPQEKYKVIHVAGTSGKTSTCYYIAALLRAADTKVGLTVSPYVDEVNERLQINLEPLPEAEFCSKLSKFLDIVAGTGIKPTYFEFLVAFAFWEFANQKADYAVVEVGLGGLLDGTNVIGRPDKVCVITDIGLDHTNILGNNLTDITTQKAGIIQRHNQVIMNKQQDNIMQVVKTKVKNEAAALLIASQNQDMVPNDLPWFQQQNWRLAYKVYQYLAERDGLMKLGQAQTDKARHTYIPARMEIIQRNSKTLIMDGAHNPQKIQALVKSLQLKFPGKKMTVIIGLLSGKDLNVKGVMKELKLVANQIIATAFSAEQDMPRGSIDPTEIVEICHQLDMPAIVINRPEGALLQTINSAEPIILITGSFYLLNNIRPLIFKSGD